MYFKKYLIKHLCQPSPELLSQILLAKKMVDSFTVRKGRDHLQGRGPASARGVHRIAGPEGSGRERQGAEISSVF